MKKVIYIAIIAGVSVALYAGNAYMERATMTTAFAGTSTPTQVVDTSSDVEKARKQLEEATSKLNAEEQKVLADTEQASSTAHAQVAEILSKYAEIKESNDKKIDEINSIRSSF
jgi:uncharacterized protein HemX